MKNIQKLYPNPKRMCEQKIIGATSKEKTETRFQTYSPLLIYLNPLYRGVP
jgi:hypothetical protein